MWCGCAFLLSFLVCFVFTLVLFLLLFLRDLSKIFDHFEIYKTNKQTQLSKSRPSSYSCTGNVQATLQYVGDPWNHDFQFCSMKTYLLVNALEVIDAV